MKSSRIMSIDFLRGIVMVLMALDHVRDYFHINALTGNYPENLESTTPVLFFTRFITHYCAPVFILLAGTSAFLYGQGKSKGELSKFLITRGLWLIFIEIFVNNFLWWFDVSFSFINLQVIWAIGLCMFILGLAVHLPKRLILVLGLLIIFGHNLLDSITFEGKSGVAILWYLTHQMSFVPLGDNFSIAFYYPFLAWMGVIFVGYSLGEFYSKEYDAKIRKKWLLAIGLCSIVLFFILRGANVYGDLIPWEVQTTPEKTVISFFNVAKYPPSLSYLLITLGPALIILAYLENLNNLVSRFFITFGRVPFFYYLLHILLIHLLAIFGLLITGKDWRLMILDNETMMGGALQGYGYPLWTVYIIWIAVVLLLFPLCKWYMNYKSRNKEKWWLSYL